MKTLARRFCRGVVLVRVAGCRARSARARATGWSRSRSPISTTETAFFEKLGFKVELDTTLGQQIPVRWLVSGNQRIELLKIADSQPPGTECKPPAHAAVRGIAQITLSTRPISKRPGPRSPRSGSTPALDITATSRRSGSR